MLNIFYQKSHSFYYHPKQAPLAQVTRTEEISSQAIFKIDWKLFRKKQNCYLTDFSRTQVTELDSELESYRAISSRLNIWSHLAVMRSLFLEMVGKSLNVKSAPVKLAVCMGQKQL